MRPVEKQDAMRLTSFYVRWSLKGIYFTNRSWIFAQILENNTLHWDLSIHQTKRKLHPTKPLIGTAPLSLLDICIAVTIGKTNSSFVNFTLFHPPSHKVFWGMCKIYQQYTLTYETIKADDCKSIAWALPTLMKSNIICFLKNEMQFLFLCSGWCSFD